MKIPGITVRWLEPALTVAVLLLFLAMARQGASQVVLVVKNLPANARDVGDVGLIPGL